MTKHFPAKAFFAVLIILAALPLCAQAPAATPPPPPEQGFWKNFFDNAVGISILIIFFSAVITALVQTRKRDRVLRDFHDYDITVILENGKRIWGVAQVYPNGVVMNYRQPFDDPQGQTKLSFVLHASEFPAVRAILRRDQGLTPELRERRNQELYRFHNPTALQRVDRWLMIQLSIVRDALVRSIGVLIGQAKRRALPNSTVGSIVTAQEAEITKVSGTLANTVWDLASDPILESFYARACYLEMKEATGGWREMRGILKEYSPTWIELLATVWPLPVEFTLPPGAQRAQNAESNSIIMRDGDTLVIQNQPPEEIELCEVFLDGESQAIEQTRIGPTSSLRLDLPDSAGKTIRLRMTSYEPADVILPRAVTLLRHKAPGTRQSWKSKIGLQRPRRRTHSPPEEY